ncbi:hypothetical protein ACQP2P_38515 [Dactylosporangium sp. CA-139114]|uniref:hypothetical protein n=1 Tax=Dactylosporangium sp. CA-139114 TaxID=3239931 RepID=UPI003D98B1A3
MSKFLLAIQRRFPHEGVRAAFASMRDELLQWAHDYIPKAPSGGVEAAAIDFFTEIVDMFIELVRLAEQNTLDRIVNRSMAALEACRRGILSFQYRIGDAEGAEEADEIIGQRFRAVEAKLRSARQDFDIYDIVYATAAEARDALSHAKEAAGITGGTELAKHYSAHAAVERWWNIGWTVLLVTLVGVSVGLAWFLVKATSNTSFSSQEVGRLALAVPLLLLAAYASRQARFHRDAAARSALVAVQLRTIIAFGDALDSAGREAMFRDFGVSLFGASMDRIGSVDPPFGLGSEIVEGLKTLANRTDAKDK